MYCAAQPSTIEPAYARSLWCLPGNCQRRRDVRVAPFEPTLSAHYELHSFLRCHTDSPISIGHHSVIKAGDKINDLRGALAVRARVHQRFCG